MNLYAIYKTIKVLGKKMGGNLWNLVLNKEFQDWTPTA
jgi:hypothetical protein